MKIIVNGACGVMGKTLSERIAGDESLSIAGLVDTNGGRGVFTKLEKIKEKGDVIIDFSHHSSVKPLLEYAVKKRIPTVIGTTGHTCDEIEYVKKSSEKIPIYYSRNMSLGIALLIKLVSFSLSAMPDGDVQIIESHRKNKLDAPSGTALMIAESVKNVRTSCEIRTSLTTKRKGDIVINSLRYGDVVGTHEVIISNDSEAIKITHEAHNRKLFADGAIAAAKYILGKPAGLYSIIE